MFKYIVLALFVAKALAGCDNQCSGHGTCGLNSKCLCYDNWGLGLSHDSGDCSDRICPYEFAWVDTPDKKGLFHKYAECAGRGICNRGTGDCECFPGYEGKACARTTCPNDCSGHGRCEYINNLGYAATPFDYKQGEFAPQEPYSKFNYNGWDKGKIRGCVCDPEYGDVDCSKRMCPYGTDIMDHRVNMQQAQKYQVQNIVFMPYQNYLIPGASQTNQLNGDGSTWGLDGKTFALTFKSKLNETFTTRPIVFRSKQAGFHQFLANIQNALLELPNRVIDSVQVQGSSDHLDQVMVNITFVGDHVQGPQNLLTVKHIVCSDGCTPKLTGVELSPGLQNVTQVVPADFNSFECGRRGKCDYQTGICTCFEGYTGLACNTITALV